jgi:hypothetical protein
LQRTTQTRQSRTSVVKADGKRAVPGTVHLYTYHQYIIGIDTGNRNRSWHQSDDQTFTLDATETTVDGAIRLVGSEINILVKHFEIIFL